MWRCDQFECRRQIAHLVELLTRYSGDPGSNPCPSFLPSHYTFTWNQYSLLWAMCKIDRGKWIMTFLTSKLYIQRVVIMELKVNSDKQNDWYMNVTDMNRNACRWIIWDTNSGGQIRGCWFNEYIVSCWFIGAFIRWTHYLSVFCA